MSAGTDAIVTVLSGVFWGEGGIGTELLSSASPDDLRGLGVDVSTLLGDEVAQAMQAITKCPALLAEVKALDEKDDWTENDLLLLKAEMITAGIV